MQNKYGKKVYSKLLIVLLISAILLVYLLATPRDVRSRETPPEPTYSVMPIKAENINISNTYVGFITPIHSVSVIPYINGFLDQIMVKGGQEVKAGETMIIIKQDEYKAQLDAAKAEVMQADATYMNAELYYDRVKKAGPKAISKTELDNAKASFLSSQASLAQAKAKRDLAQVNYNYTIIKAPIDGIVGNVNLTKGEYVSPASKSLLKIIQNDPIRVVFSITDKDYLAKVSQGQSDMFAQYKIKLKLSNGKMFEKIGKFQFSDNELDRTTNSLSIYADFENMDKALLANAYVDVILEKVFENGVMIPQSLVSMLPDGNFVYTVNNNILSKTPIEIISTQGSQYLVRNSFKTGDYLVTEKVNRFEPGQKVKINLGKVTAKTAEKK